jgi:hypothetical protein
MNCDDVPCPACPKEKWIGFAFESKGEESPISPPMNGWHEFGPSPTKSGRVALPLIGNVVWLDPADDLESTMEGKPLTHVSEALTVTVHLSEVLDYVECLPGPVSKK